LLAPRPTPKLDKWTTLSLAAGFGDPARRLRSRQHSSRGHQTSQASLSATRGSPWGGQKVF